MTKVALFESMGRVKRIFQLGGGFKDFSPTAECYGVFAQYRFRCVLGELGQFREGTGFRELVLGTGYGFRWVPTVFVVPRFRVRFREPVPGNRVPEGRLRARGFEGFGVRWVPTGYIGSVPEVWGGTGSGNPTY